MRRSTSVLAATVALCASAVAVNVVPATAGSRSIIPRSHPTWATPAARVGAARRSDRVRLRVYLALRDPAAAEAAARAVSDPKSGSYRRFLTPAQVKARYAPTDASVAKVRSWLRSQGLRPGSVPSNNQYVEATGTVASVQKAFSVELGIYRVKGQRVRGTDRDLAVPADLAGLITGVIGADQGQALVRPDHVGGRETSGSASAKSTRSTAGVKPGIAPPPDGFRNAPPCSSYWAEKVDTKDPAYGGGYAKTLPYAVCGYKPAQLRQAYGVDKYVKQGLDGRTATVAVIDAFAAPTIFHDANRYARRNDPGHPLRASQFSQVIFPANEDLEGPDECDASGWYGEETLDVEAVHAMAPAAHIVYVGGSDCQDVSLDKALNLVVSKHLASIVSNSYGDLGEDVPAAEVRGFHNIAIEAVLEGIGVYFSSGDSGDEAADLGYPSPDFSATDPLVTAVGGTSLAVGQFGERVLETGWETGKSTLTNGAWDPAAPGAFLYGSGGGSSRLYSQPFYQRGVVPNALAKKNHRGGGKGRVVPDISMDGDPNTGMLIGETQTFPNGVRYDEFRLGGTSLSSPLLAGLMALADDLTGQPHGFINPRLYQLAGSSSVRDITHVKAAVVRADYVNGLNATEGVTTSVRTFDDRSLTIKTTAGYDDVTGLGVPRGLAFLLRI